MRPDGSPTDLDARRRLAVARLGQLLASRGPEPQIRCVAVDTGPGGDHAG